MGGSSGGAPTTTTVNQSNLPAYAQPYYEELLNRTSAVSQQDYTPYQGTRIAGFSPDQQQSFDITRGMVGAEQPNMQSAQGALGYSTNAALRSTNYQAPTIGTQNFDQNAASQYMSPYMQNVVDYQKQQAQRDFAEGQGARNQSAIQGGAYGGYRNAIQQGVAQRGLAAQMQGIEATGAQNAYTNAQSQFNADVGRQLAAQQANAAAQAQGAQIQQAGAQLGMAGATGYQNLASAQQGLSTAQAQALSAQGAQQQNLQQQGLTTAYQDFVNQRDFPRQQLNFYSGILRGTPVTANSEVSQYQNPSAASQISGLGIGALGLSSMLKAT